MFIELTNEKNYTNKLKINQMKLFKNDINLFTFDYTTKKHILRIRCGGNSSLR